MEIRAAEIPFRHWVIDGFFHPESAAEAFACVPPRSWHGWDEPGHGARYDNDCERGKRTTRNIAALPEVLRAEFDAAHDLCWLMELTGEPDLRIDPLRHGAGLHVLAPGGHLQTHLDYVVHPKMPVLERRASLIVFRNPVWRESWGGALELCEDDGETVAVRIFPAPGRAVVWLNSDVAYHGVQRTAGTAPPRVTLAAYFLAPTRAGANRKRALYVPRRSG